MPSHLQARLAEDRTRRLMLNETIQIPVRLARRIFWLTGTTLFAAAEIYFFALSDSSSYGEYAFHICTAGLAVYATGALRLYYGILTKRSQLTITQQGITLGDHHLDWGDIQHVALRPSSPVLRYLAIGPPSVRIQGHQRSRDLDVTRDHVRDLDAFATWLRLTHESRADSHKQQPL